MVRLKSGTFPRLVPAFCCAKFYGIGLSNSLSLVMQKCVTARANSRYTCIKNKEVKPKK